MKTTKQINKQITTNQQEQSAIAYALYLLNQKHESALSMLKDCPQNIYIEEWKREEQIQAQRIATVQGLSNKLAKECDKLFNELHDLEQEPNKEKYYDTFWGHKVSDYAIKYGRLDYATLSKCFDAVLCNNILEVDPYLMDNLESGDFEDFYYDGEQISRDEYDEINDDLIEQIQAIEDQIATQEQGATQEQEDAIYKLEQKRDTLEVCSCDVFQWFIVSANALDLLKEANELVFYSEKLDAYIWGVCHWGTSWDYVLTSIKLREREGE